MPKNSPYSGLPVDLNMFYYITQLSDIYLTEFLWYIITTYSE